METLIDAFPGVVCAHEGGKSDLTPPHTYAHALSYSGHGEGMNLSDDNVAILRLFVERIIPPCEVVIVTTMGEICEYNNDGFIPI